ncbi:MAG TPA: Holliday junction resolvase RuvX [Vicinamibacterales bacterium]
MPFPSIRAGKRLWYPRRVRALGVDYGERRIGLALSDATGLLASPWKTVMNAGSVSRAAQQLVDEIRRLEREEPGLSAIVIGLPRRLNGEPTTLTAHVRQLASLITGSLDVPVVLQDERLTSSEADELLAGRERDWRRRKRAIDPLAAALILQDYLDHRRAVEGPTNTDPA